LTEFYTHKTPIFVIYISSQNTPLTETFGAFYRHIEPMTMSEYILVLFVLPFLNSAYYLALKLLYLLYKKEKKNMIVKTALKG